MRRWYGGRAGELWLMGGRGEREWVDGIESLVIGRNRKKGRICGRSVLRGVGRALGGLRIIGGGQWLFRFPASGAISTNGSAAGRSWLRAMLSHCWFLRERFLSGRPGKFGPRPDKTLFIAVAGPPASFFPRRPYFDRRDFFRRVPYQGLFGGATSRRTHRPLPPSKHLFFHPSLPALVTPSGGSPSAICKGHCASVSSGSSGPMEGERPGFPADQYHGQGIVGMGHRSRFVPTPSFQGQTATWEVSFPGGSGQRAGESSGATGSAPSRVFRELDCLRADTAASPTFCRNLENHTLHPPVLLPAKRGRRERNSSPNPQHQGPGFPSFPLRRRPLPRPGEGFPREELFLLRSCLPAAIP